MFKQASNDFKKLLLVSAVLATGGMNLHAAGITGGTVVVAFSNPVLAGLAWAGLPTLQGFYEDDTSTAVYGISNNVTGSNLTWGTCTGAGCIGQPFSQLSFVGSTIPASPTSPFNLGTITFTNGTSNGGTGIFGATMSFYYNTISAANLIATDKLIITTTFNTFGVPGGLTNGDDDYINICGNNSNICSTSIEAVESSEGGVGIKVNLLGTIVGDPVLTVTGAALAPGQNSTVNGFLGADPGLGVAPEPATWTMLGSALAAGIFALRRKRLKSN